MTQRKHRAALVEAPDGVASDPRFVRRHGLFIFAGELTAEAIPDHRALREERIDAFVEDASPERQPD